MIRNQLLHFFCIFNNVYRFKTPEDSNQNFELLDLTIKAIQDDLGAVVSWNFTTSCGVGNYKIMILDLNRNIIINQTMDPNEIFNNGHFEIKDQNEKLETCKSYILKIQPIEKKVAKGLYDGLEREFKYINIKSLDYKFKEGYNFKEGFIKFHHNFDCIEVYDISIYQGEESVFQTSAITTLGDEITLDLRKVLTNCDDYKLKFHPKWIHPSHSNDKM